jgi:hypothetical protein
VGWASKIELRQVLMGGIVGIMELEFDTTPPGPARVIPSPRNLWPFRPKTRQVPGTCGDHGPARHAGPTTPVQARPLCRARPTGPPYPADPIARPGQGHLARPSQGHRQSPELVAFPAQNSTSPRNLRRSWPHETHPTRPTPPHPAHKPALPLPALPLPRPGPAEVIASPARDLWAETTTSG